MPRGSGHLICAGSTLGGGSGAFRTGVRRRCASACDALTSSATAAITLTYRMIEVYLSGFAAGGWRLAAGDSRLAVRRFGIPPLVTKAESRHNEPARATSERWQALGVGPQRKVKND